MTGFLGKTEKWGALLDLCVPLSYNGKNAKAASERDGQHSPARVAAFFRARVQVHRARF